MQIGNNLYNYLHILRNFGGFSLSNLFYHFHLAPYTWGWSQDTYGTSVLSWDLTPWFWHPSRTATSAEVWPWYLHSMSVSQGQDQMGTHKGKRPWPWAISTGKLRQAWVEMHQQGQNAGLASELGPGISSLEGGMAQTKACCLLLGANWFILVYPWASLWIFKNPCLSMLNDRLS
jgi:hypothetical protein